MLSNKKRGKTAQSLQDNLRNLENGLKNLRQGGVANHSQTSAVQSNALSGNSASPSALNGVNGGIGASEQNTFTREIPGQSRWHKYINLVMNWVEKVSGIKPDKRVYIKLEHLFKEKNQSQLEILINQITHQDHRTGQSKLFDVIEQLTVHETFFFREMEQLLVLQQEVLPLIIEQQKSLPFPSIRILSAACSTGEEVYSLAILTVEVLKQYGLAQMVGEEVRIKPPWTVTIDGIDISRKAVSIARQAKYYCHNEVKSLACHSCTGQLCSFRAMPKGYFDFFSMQHATPGQLDQAHGKVNPSLQRLTRFKVHNLTQALDENNYHIIICRNVLIYFDAEKKRLVQNNLYNALNPGGVLLLGSSDSLLIQNKFKLEKSKYSVYFVKPEIPKN